MSYFNSVGGGGSAVDPHHVDADPDFYLMRMRILLFTLMLMRPDPTFYLMRFRILFFCGSGTSKSGTGNLMDFSIKFIKLDKILIS